MSVKAIDRRVRRTRPFLPDALLELILEKGYEAVTVQDVLERANVGRSTFYAHFQDKEDLFLSEFDALRSEFEEHLGMQEITANTVWDLSLHMFRHARDHFRLYKALAGKASGSVILDQLNRYLAFLLRDHLNVYYEEDRQIEVPVEILSGHLVSSFMALLTWWLDHDLAYPPDQMNEIYRRLTQPGMEELLGKME
jgi:AcrR family transcriptional regulator